MVRFTLGYIVDDYCLTFVGEGGGSYCSWLYGGRLLLEVSWGRGMVRIALGYIVDDYCLTFVRGGVVRIALGYIEDDYCLTFMEGKKQLLFFFSISVNPVFSCIHFCQCEILS